MEFEYQFIEDTNDFIPWLRDRGSFNKMNKLIVEDENFPVNGSDDEIVKYIYSNGDDYYKLWKNDIRVFIAEREKQCLTIIQSYFDICRDDFANPITYFKVSCFQYDEECWDLYCYLDYDENVTHINLPPLSNLFKTCFIHLDRNQIKVRLNVNTVREMLEANNRHSNGGDFLGP